MDSRAGLEGFEAEKIYCSCQNSNPELRYPGSRVPGKTKFGEISRVYVRLEETGVWYSAMLGSVMFTSKGILIAEGYQICILLRARGNTMAT